MLRCSDLRAQSSPAVLMDPPKSPMPKKFQSARAGARRARRAARRGGGRPAAGRISRGAELKKKGRAALNLN